MLNPTFLVATILSVAMIGSSTIVAAECYSCLLSSEKAKHVWEAAMHLRQAGLEDDASRLAKSVLGIEQAELERSVDTLSVQILPKEISDDRTVRKIKNRAKAMFEKHQLPVLLERYEVATIEQLDTKLAEKCISVEIAQLRFMEAVFTSEIERRAK